MRTNPLPVLLLAAVDANLRKSEGGKETNVPGDHQKPELVSNTRTNGEVGEVLADGFHKSTEERLSTESLNANIGGKEPSCKSDHQGQRLLVEPLVATGSRDTDGSADRSSS